MLNNFIKQSAPFYPNRRIKFTAFYLAFFFILCVIYPSGSVFAENNYSPTEKLNKLRQDLENDKIRTEKEISQYQTHLQKCQGFLSSLSSSKDQAAISVTEQAIIKDRDAIATGKLKLQEIAHRLKLTSRAQQYLHGDKKNGIGLSCQEIKGDVFIVRSDGKKIRIQDNMTPSAGDMIITGKDSHIVLMTLDGSKIFLKAESKFQLIEDNFDSSTSKILKGKVGIFIAHTKRLLKRRFNVRTPTVAIAVRGTKFDVEIDKNGKTHIYVYEGTVEINKNVILNKGQTWVEK